ncbi:MAG TPA: tetratricopeptide repeat protein, partial [Thermoanaerobaculia bacterium]|nr:tetratricopeptide repeat protein [Thermoanaerobaculia bacterium]
AEQVKELLVSIFRQADPETGQGPDLTAGEILAAGAKRVETELAREPRIQAELLDAIAQIQGSLGQFDPAAEAASTALARRRALFGAESVPVAQSLTTLAELAANRGRLEEAIRLAERAGPAFERHAGPESPDRQRLDRVRVFLLRHQAEPERALALVEELLEANRRHFGPTSVQTARLLINRAEVLGDLSRFAEAEQAVRQALAILEASPQVTRLEVSYARRGLADLLESLDRHQEAAAEFDAVLALQRAELGPRHRQVAFTRIAQGFLLSEMRRFPEAEATLREAIRILEPLDHFEIGSARCYLGICMMSQERYAEAERQFSEAERFLRTKLEADHPLVWGSRISQGIAQLRLGRLGEARRTLSEVVDHYARTEPESDGNRSALKHLGEVAWREGRIDEALALHRQARQIEVKIFGTEKHVGVAFSDYLIALDLLARGDPGSLAEARQRIDAAIAVLRHENAGHPTLNRFLLASGRIALAVGDEARARQDLTDAVARLRGFRGPDHPDTREAEALLRRAS